MTPTSPSVALITPPGDDTAPTANRWNGPEAVTGHQDGGRTGWLVGWAGAATAARGRRLLGDQEQPPAGRRRARLAGRHGGRAAPLRPPLLPARADGVGPGPPALGERPGPSGGPRPRRAPPRGRAGAGGPP